MRRSRFLWKLYAGYVFLILLATGIVGTLLAVRVERDTLADIDRRLRAEAMLLRDIAATELSAPRDAGQRESRLQRRVEDLGEEIGTRLTIIRADGVVIAESDINPARMDNHGSRPEVLEALERGVGTSSRYSDSVHRQMRYFALTVTIDGELLGFARASVPLDVISSRLGQLRNAVVVAAAVAIVVALVLGFLYARRVTKPVRRMAAAAEAIVGGRDHGRVEIHTGDELGDMARAFNTMNDKLQHSIATVETDRNKLEAILASMVEGVVAVDREQRVVHMNEVARQLLGITSEYVTGRELGAVVGVREISAVLSETLARGRLVHRVLELPGAPQGGAAKGRDRTLDVHASPLQAGGETFSGAVLVLDDITQLRRLETVRRDFVGNVSHELKTPVTAIRGLVETLLDDPEIDPIRRVRFMTKIRNQAERLTSLVTDLLSLSRLESGGLNELEPIDVRRAVERSAHALKSTAEARRIAIVTESPPHPVMVEADEEILIQAVSNLLDNALKYTSGGGSVWARVRNDGDEHVVIEIQDTGIGIEPRHHHRIFERFYRVDKARSRELGGTGLGLAIVKHIALALGGEVSLDSSPGCGSTFRIRLPRTESPAYDEHAYELDPASVGYSELHEDVA
jgi:two-component system phosphate regulon sensor histidine kinase PhoR